MTADAVKSRPWLALQTTLYVQMLATLVLSTGPVLAPAVAPQLGLAPDRVGLFTATGYLFAMLSGVASGGWVNRLGGARVSQLLLLAVAAGAAVATLGTGWGLLCAAALIGLGTGAANPSSAVLLGQHAPTGARGLFFGLKQSGVPIGVALSGVLMPLGLLVLGWQGAAWVAAGACLLTAVLLVPVVPRLDARERGAAPLRSPIGRTLMLVLRQPALRKLALVSLVYAMVQHGFLTFSVALLTLELKLPLALAAGLLAISQVACTLVRIALGHVGDRWVAPRLLLGVLGLAMAASCLALGTLPRAPALPLVAFVMIACGSTAMGWNAVYFAQLLRVVPREELAASTGGVQFFTFAGGMAGPFLFAQLLQAGGSYTLGYACLAALGAAGGVAMLREDRGGTSAPSRAVA